MRLSEVQFGGMQAPIDGYGPGFFRVGGRIMRGNLLLAEDGARDWGGLDDRTQLLALAGKVDVLFLGLGPELAPLPAAFRAACEGAGRWLEPMTTPSACRSYNVVLAEGRRIAAALIAMP